MTTRNLGLATLLFAAQAVSAQDTLPVAVIPQDSLTALVRERVASGRNPGLIVGVIRPDGSHMIVAEGFARPGVPVDTNTLFEIGSITKVFTGILLADMVNTGMVRLDQPVAELLPSTVKVPSRNGRQITLLDLSTHRSAVPRLPGNMAPRDSTNPYADYTVQQMYDFISAHELRRDIGSMYEYSNLAVGLLGHALALRAGQSYEDWLRYRVLRLLDMTNTFIALTPAAMDQMAQGHSGSGKPVSLWDIPTLAGAGALRSSMNDMLKFISAVLNPKDNHPGRAIRLSLEPHHRASPALALGLGWHRTVFQGDTIVWHNGGTGGFRTFAGINPRTRVGVVVLGNSTWDNDDLGRHILNPKYQLSKIVVRTPIALPVDSLRPYVGTYALSPVFALDVTLEGDSLYVRATDQPRFAILAEARDKFFLTEVDAQLEFERDALGQVTAVYLVQNGRHYAPRKK